MLISIIIPVYNSAHTLKELTTRIKTTLGTITEDFEIIFINDGSEDNSWDIIQALEKKNVLVEVITKVERVGELQVLGHLIGIGIYAEFIYHKN